MEARGGPTGQEEHEERSRVAHVKHSSRLSVPLSVPQRRADDSAHMPQQCQGTNVISLATLLLICETFFGKYVNTKERRHMFTRLTSVPG